MNKTKRLLALVLALVMSLTLFACGRKAQDDKTDDSTRTEDTTRVFTDSCGREVTVPVNVEKIAISGPLAQIVVFALAPDKLVGIANAWDESAAEFLDTKYYDQRNGCSTRASRSARLPTNSGSNIRSISRGCLKGLSARPRISTG